MTTGLDALESPAVFPLLLFSVYCGQLLNKLVLASEEQEMEVSGRMCASHALRPLSLAAMWMPELTQYLHCQREAGGE